MKSRLQKQSQRKAAQIPTPFKSPPLVCSQSKDLAQRPESDCTFCNNYPTGKLKELRCSSQSSFCLQSPSRSFFHLISNSSCVFQDLSQHWIDLRRKCILCAINSPSFINRSNQPHPKQSTRDQKNKPGVWNSVALDEYCQGQDPAQRSVVCFSPVESHTLPSKERPETGL